MLSRHSCRISASYRYSLVWYFAIWGRWWNLNKVLCHQHRLVVDDDLPLLDNSIGLNQPLRCWQNALIGRFLSLIETNNIVMLVVHWPHPDEWPQGCRFSNTRKHCLTRHVFATFTINISVEKLSFNTSLLFTLKRWVDSESSSVRKDWSICWR